MISQTMVQKCLCPCPDYIKIPLPNGARQTVYLKGFGTVLHGKKANEECMDCGKPLCEKCAVITGRTYDGEEYPFAYLCPSCAEVTR